jgi:lipopolysaccharide/colanic/teichoic acid biosynthesis glycosyltransferase
LSAIKPTHNTANTDSQAESVLEVESTRTPSAHLRSRVKRIIDVIFSLIGLVITLVIAPFIAILIKIDSRGSILYRQTRLGIDGRQFNVIKFRTMVRDAESDNGPAWASPNDPRITRVGVILRKLYIDEFPQWWNVLVGEMSVVGPRPERPELVELITKQYPNFRKRLETKPGITGLAQTEYRYASSVSDSRHKLNYDQRYIQNASILLDTWIVLRTFRRMLLRRGT